MRDSTISHKPREDSTRRAGSPAQDDRGEPTPRREQDPPPRRGGSRRALTAAAAVAAWLVIWLAAARLIGQEMLLASPEAVAQRLAELAVTPGFWSSLAFSVSRILLGFCLALAAGLLLAAAAYRLSAAAVFLRPFMSAVKAAPVASYIILCLLFMPSRGLSVFIAFTMALPVIYTNVLNGLFAMDPKLLEMADVFGIGPARRIVSLYFSQLIPHLLSACGLALGLCWKAGVAAEVIGLPRGSIGEALYQAKIFVDTKSVMAWTVVVIAISFLLEKALLGLIRRLAALAERV
ncbi:MAG: ABC transporter permease subunit [Clostridiales bacterium]|jgi:NitT/TauT family transport system permease protein|nr:ABC transporter permease subunit [Clostridiales bacterium]